jgi:hypothetical protein
MSTTPAHGPGPSYCVGRILPAKPLTPSQWVTCWKYGWDESTTTASRFGYDFGHNVLPALLVLAVIILAVIVLARSIAGT